MSSNIPDPDIEFVSRERYDALQKMDEYEEDIHDRNVIAGKWPWWRKILHPYRPITVDEFACIYPEHLINISKRLDNLAIAASISLWETVKTCDPLTQERK